MDETSKINVTEEDITAALRRKIDILSEENIQLYAALNRVLTTNTELTDALTKARSGDNT